MFVSLFVHSGFLEFEISLSRQNSSVYFSNNLSFLGEGYKMMFVVDEEILFCVKLLVHYEVSCHIFTMFRFVLVLSF